MFRYNGQYDDAWKAEPLTHYHYWRCDTVAESDVNECLVLCEIMFVLIFIIVHKNQ